MMTPDELRQAYLDFFVKKSHVVIPSASLVPENDPTTLFTGSGMQPLIGYLLGETHPQGFRLVNSQPCFRSQDIEEIGDNRHTTFFEMLGNWSLGDYFKSEQLEWIFTFLTQEVGLDPARLNVSVYAGDDQLGIPQDEEAAKIWQKLFEKVGLTTDGRIFYYQHSNWWSRVGEPAQMPVGEPGGPDSEIFYDFGDELNLHQQSPWADQPCHPNCECGRFLEIGNSVFMTYQKTEAGFVELNHKNIDFGGGLERILAAHYHTPDVFKTPLFTPLIKYLEEISGLTYEQNVQATQVFRILADHLKAATMLAASGIYPDNKEQGYFVRRLLRRAMRYADLINLETNFLTEMVDLVVVMYQGSYPLLASQAGEIKTKFAQEEQKFKQALKKGLALFQQTVGSQLTAQVAFTLFETYGFPLEMSIEEAQRQELTIQAKIEVEFERLKLAHAQASRVSSQGKFKGGLQDESKTTVQYHTVTHLLHAALCKILGDKVKQQGSNITAARLRFDFSFDRALTSPEIQAVEKLMNKWIDADLPVSVAMLSKQAALDSGATAFFAQKYPDQVSVYTIGQDAQTDWISKELCGGPHVSRTSDLSAVEIFKEKSSAAGIRRIYARFK